MAGVKQARDGAVGVLTLDEPASLNAMTPDLLGAHAAPSRIAPRSPLALRLDTLFFELFDGAVAAIGFPGSHELLGALAVARQAVALVKRPLVPLHAEPLQRADDLLGVVLLGALDVGVLDAQQHRAAVAPGVEEIEDRGARAADV